MLVTRWDKASNPLPTKLKPKKVKGTGRGSAARSGRIGAMEARMEKMFSMVSTLSSAFAASSSRAESNLPLGGLGAQGSYPAPPPTVPGGSSEPGTVRENSETLGSPLTHSVSPPALKKAGVLDTTSPSLGPGLPGHFGDGVPASAPVHPGSGVGHLASVPAYAGPVAGVPGLGPGHGDPRSPAGAPMDTRPVNPWASSMEATTRGAPSGLSGFTTIGAQYPTGDHLIPDPGYHFSGRPGPYTVPAIPQPVGSITGRGTSFPLPGMSVSAGGVMPGQAFTGLSSVMSTGVPAPWALGYPPGPRQPAHSGYAGAQRAPMPSLSQAPRAWSEHRDYTFPRVSHSPPSVTTSSATSVVDSVIYTGGGGSASGVPRNTGPVQGHQGGYRPPPSATVTGPTSHLGASAPVDPPQGGMTVQACIEFLAAQGVSIDQSSETTSVSDDRDTQTYDTVLEGSYDLVEGLIPFHDLLDDLESRFPGSLASGPQSSKPISAGLEQLGASKDASSKARLPLVPSLDQWFKYHNQILAGDAPTGARQKVKHHPLKTYPKPPALSDKYNLAEGSGACTKLEPPPNWYRLAAASSSASPAAVSITTKDFQDLGRQVNRVLPVLSSLSWMAAGGSNVLKGILEDPVNPPSPQLLLLKRYFLEILRALEVLELHQSGISSHLMWRTRDAFLGRVHASVPTHSKEALRSGDLTSSPFLFQESAVDEIAATLKSDLSLESHSKALSALSGVRSGSSQAQPSKRRANVPAKAPAAKDPASTQKQVRFNKPAAKKSAPKGKPSSGAQGPNKQKPKYRK